MKEGRNSLRPFSLVWYNERMKDKPLIFDDGGEWQVFDLLKEGCAGVPLVSRSKFRAVSYVDELHVHSSFVEIFFCMKGCVRYETADGEMRILPGQVFASRPDQPHRRISSPKGMCLYRAVISVPLPRDGILDLPPSESRFLERSFRGFIRRVSQASVRVRPAFERLFTVCETMTPGTVERRLNIKSSALELLLALAETFQHPQREQPFSRPKVEAIIQRITEDPTADYSVPGLAREAALSPVALNNAFKRITGFTPHAYLLDRRVQNARRDIERGASIPMVAAKYRFPSASHFATVFRRIVGCSPRDCRKMS